MSHKVLIEVERLKYPFSGIANVCKSLIKGLERSESQFSYAFFGPKNFLITFTKKQIFPVRPWSKVVQPKTSEFQLIHVTHQLSRFFHKKADGQKKIVTLHDLNYLHDSSSKRKKTKSHRLVQKNLKDADTIVCISNFAKDDFQKNKDRFQLKKNVEITTVYNGIIFPEQKQFQSENFDFFKEHEFILNIGVLFPKKNQLALLYLLEGNKKHLVIVGSAAKEAYKTEFLEKVKNLGLLDRVHILEKVDENNKNFLLQNCESYVHPSLAEGFGIPPIEAMFFGKPVFLSKLTSLPEIGGDHAFYFDDFEAETVRNTYQRGMELYRKNQTEYEKNAKNWVDQFDYRTMAKNYEEIYRRILK